MWSVLASRCSSIAIASSESDNMLCRRHANVADRLLVHEKLKHMPRASRRQPPLPVIQSVMVSVPLMKITTLSPLYITVANGQYSPVVVLPSACHTVLKTVHPAGTFQLRDALPMLGVPGVTVVGVLVAAQPAHSSKLRRFFQIQ
jgi:hypothetical protein